MTETQQIPDAVRWAVAALDNQDRRSTALETEINHYERQLADAVERRRAIQQEMQTKLQQEAALAELIEQLKQAHRDKGVALTAARRNATHLRRMAEVVCSDEGIELPAPPAEPSMYQTGEFPVIADPLEPLPPNVVDGRNGNGRPAQPIVDARTEPGVCPACRLNHIPWCTGNADPLDDAGPNRLPLTDQPAAPFRPEGEAQDRGGRRG